MSHHKFFLFGMAILSVFLVAKGQSAAPCRPLNSTVQGDFENAFGAPIAGCRLNGEEAMTAVSRLHWIIPVGEQANLDVEGTGTNLSTTFAEAGARRGQTDMIIETLNAANQTFEQAGLLTVSTSCIAGLEPDLVSSILANADDPEGFNAALVAECEDRGIDTTGTMRISVSLEVIIRIAISICVYVISSTACGVTVAVITSIMVTITAIFRIGPCVPGTV